jgi:RimJ/RimL family protein N-acetyltransferase
MILESELVRLRTFTLGDVPAILAMSQEDCARRWLPSQVCRDAAHAAELTNWLIQQFDLRVTPTTNAFVFGVEEKTSGRLVGHVGLSPLFDSVEVGFGIAAAVQGKGYAKEAVTMACKWAFRQFSLPAILGVTDYGNVASQRVLARCGFRKTEERLMRMQGAERRVVIFELKPGQPIPESSVSASPKRNPARALRREAPG